MGATGSVRACLPVSGASELLLHCATFDTADVRGDAAAGDNGVHGAEEGDAEDDVFVSSQFGAKPMLFAGASMLGVGGAVREVPGAESDANFIKDLAAEFISTKLIGNMPIRSPILPSAQLSSTRRMTVIMSDLENERQSFSSTSVTRKS